MPSLVLIKPDAFEHRIAGRLLGHFEQYVVEDMRFGRIDADLCQAHYREHVGKTFYPGLQEFMLSGPTLAVQLAGRHDSIRSWALTLRRAYEDYEGPCKGPRNLIHASDSYLSAELELDVWFPNRPIRWNPFNKVVCDHRDGTTHIDETDAVRAYLGLPVPWTSEIAERECREKPVFMR